MEKYVVREKPRLLRSRNLWKRSLIELQGRFQPEYRHSVSSLLTQSYSEIGAFPHKYHVDRLQCSTHYYRDPTDAGRAVYGDSYSLRPSRSHGISSIDFDSKGVYLVSVTKSGCLTVHDFEALCCHSNASRPCLEEDERKLVVHLSLCRPLDVVRWNITNQDEVACTSVKNNAVLIFDISYISSEPIQVLTTRRSITVHGSEVHKGLTDIAFSMLEKSRLIASDTNGVVNLWDRRMGNFPCLELTTDSRSTINSIKVDTGNQMVFGAGRHGTIYMWDLRGGSSSTGFQSHKKAGCTPMLNWKLASMLEKIGTLKAQAGIVPKEVHSLDLDPSCPYQLAFHLDDGWSGVLDIYNCQVTHVHCPPPAWLNDSNISADPLCLRKPSWLPTNSIYAVGSTSAKGIHLLDFYPDPSSPCHVDYSEDLQRHSSTSNQDKKNKFVPLSETVTACAAHPINGDIIAGTENASLLLVSQKKQSSTEA